MQQKTNSSRLRKSGTVAGRAAIRRCSRAFRRRLRYCSGQYPARVLATSSGRSFTSTRIE